jgi:mannose/fructose/N-acetylgalactosamine-specific phosphotransferase system component IIB
MSDDKLIWDPYPNVPQPKTLDLRNPAFTIFPEELIALRQEIQKHPLLLELLHDQENKDVYIQIAEIATYCNIILDGDYTQQDVLGICKACTQALMSKRTLVILPFTS